MRSVDTSLELVYNVCSVERYACSMSCVMVLWACALGAGLALGGAGARVTVFVSDSAVERVGARLYKKTLLTDLYQSPKELTYDSASRNLFFMHMDDALQDSGRAYVNVITKKTRKIEGISRNKATAVDSDTGDVYFGSDNGLYKYDAVNNSAVNIALYNMNIMQLVVRNNDMFLLDANDHMVYKVMDRFRVAVKAGNLRGVMLFEVDAARNVHVVSVCGVYCAVRGQELVRNADLRTAHHLLVADGATFAVNDDGVFRIDCARGVATRVATLDFVPDSITLGDYGDIYYSHNDAIYRLKPINSYILYNIKRRT